MLYTGVVVVSNIGESDMVDYEALTRQEDSVLPLLVQ